MTPTSDERRDVAERLRDDNHGHGTEYDFFLHALGMSREGRGPCDWGKVHKRLADLIDPCPSMADEQMGKLRRRSTALASMTRIASDMSGWAGELADSCERMSRARIADDVRRFADRIRQEARDALN